MSDSDDTHAKTQQLLQLMWSDMKEMNRALNAKIDDKIDRLDTKLSARIEAVDTKLSARIDAVDTKLTSRMDSMDRRLSGRIDENSAKLAVVSAELATIHLRIDHSHEDVMREVRASRVATTEMLGMLVRADTRQDAELDAIRARLSIAEAQLGLR